MKRITTRDVAAEADVSLATVDRVINNRSGVSDKTVARIHAVIDKLGYVRDINAVNLVKNRTYRIMFIFPDYDNDFMDQLQNEILSLNTNEEVNRTVIDIEKVPPLDALALAKTLDSVSEEAYTGVVFVAIDAVVVADAVNRLKERGLVAVTIVSDLVSPAVSHFVGINNVAAGRTAGGLLGRFLSPTFNDKKKKVAVVAGSMTLVDHMQRRSGFEQVLKSEYPHLKVLPIIEGHDDNALTQKLLDELFEKYDDIAGLYSLGAAKAGVVASLKKHDRTNKITTIAHDLTELSRTSLFNGTFDAVIDQDTAHQARSAVRVVKAIADQSPISQSKERISIDIYLRDNLPGALKS